MRKLLLTITFGLILLSIKAQTITPSTIDTPKSLKKNHNSTFPNFDRLNQYVKNNIKFTGDKGEAVVSFVVEKDGSFSDIKIYKSLSTKADEESIRLIKSSPKIIPATVDGQPTRIKYSFVIKFH